MIAFQHISVFARPHIQATGRVMLTCQISQAKLTEAHATMSGAYSFNSMFPLTAMAPRMAIGQLRDDMK